MEEKEHKLRWVFKSIVKRCTYKNHKSSYLYVLKWIKCEWKSADDFISDMGSTYELWLSIDRIDGDKNYCKENCRWADRVTQNNNRSCNIIVEPWLTLSQWCRKEWYRHTTVRSWYTKWMSIGDIKEKCRIFDWEKDRTHFETPELQEANHVTYQNWYYLNVTKKKRQERRNKKLHL